MHDVGGTPNPSEKQDDRMTASDMTTSTLHDHDANEARTGRSIRVTAVLFCVIVWAAIMYYAFG